MTDKQIIIDKYPDCEYYNFSLGGICDQTTLSGNGKNCAKCSDINGCFIKELYKQLKRKEKVCKEWKEEYRAKVEELNELEEKLLRKEQECKKLEKELAKVYEDIKLSPLCYKCDEEECLQKEIDKLKQALTEIEGIAEPYRITIKKICGNCKKYDDCHACCYKDINCYKYTRAETNACEEFVYLDEFVPNILANNILQKISEVIPSEN